MIVPFTAKHPETVEAAPAGAEWHNVGSDDQAYWRLLRDVWADGETFMVLEHDVIARPDVVPAFDGCDRPWCAFGYSDICHPACMEAWANTLGCTRFTADLIAAVPDAMSSITRPEHLDWHNLCDGIGGNLRAAGFTHHWHEPAVDHIHLVTQMQAGWKEGAPT